MSIQNSYYISPDKIRYNADLESIVRYKPDNNLLLDMAQDIKDHQYKDNNPLLELPLTLWKGHDHALIDGRKRLAAAERAGIKEVLVCEKEFATLLDVAIYCFDHKIKTKTLTQADILNLASTLQIKDNRDGSGGVSEIFAKQINVGRTTIMKARAVFMRSPIEDVQKIQKGEMTINAAYKKLHYAKV